MQQRRVRLGDILDDYCPRERRITNHAVVAMIDDRVKQTRCTTCDADHEYREGKLPAARRRKVRGLASGDAASGVIARPAAARTGELPAAEELPDAQELPDAEELPEAEEVADATTGVEPLDVPIAAAESAAEETDDRAGADRDEWPVHRPLIRATLPRPEGQVPERKAPDFTFRPAGGRSERNGQRHRHRPMRHAHGQPAGQGRAGSGQGSRQGAGQQGHNQRSGQRQGHAGGARPGRGREPRPGGGRKRGR